MSKDVNSQFLEVREYLEASILRAARVPLQETRLDPDNRVTFVFEDHDGTASEALREHRSGNLRLPSLDFLQSVLLTKQEMFATRRGGGLS